MSSPASVHELFVAPELAGTRLDRALAAAAGAPRNQVQGWIEAGRVLVDGLPADRAGRALRAGETVRWETPPPADPRIAGAEGELVILHLDDDLIVLDKPAGISMHPGASRADAAPATLAHILLGRFPELAGVGGPGRPGIVHRLDKETSGVVAVARTAPAYERLSRAFAERRVEKRYLAIAHGLPEPRSGKIEQPIGRHPVKRKQMAVRAAGRPAVTLYRTLGEAPRQRNRQAFALLELDLRTGRTHQIRVHLKHLRHPIAGDPTYGGGASGAPRLALHAWRLAFDHPRSGERVEFRAPCAPDLAAWWRSIGGTGLPEE